MPIDIEGRIIFIDIKIYLLRIKDNAFLFIDIGVEQIIDEIIKFRKKKSDKKDEAGPILIYGNISITFRIAVKYIYAVIVVFDVEFLDLFYQRFFNSVTNYLFETDIYRQVEKTPVFIIIKIIFFLARILVLTGLL